MQSLDALLLSTWHTLEPSLRAHRLELHSRSLRLSQPSLSRPIRPWCIALRASDTRLDRFACIIPRDGPQLLEPHHIILDTTELRELVRPVYIEDPIDWTIAARLLGRHPESLRTFIARGTLRVKKFPPSVSGKRGKPLPFVWSPRALDPNANNFDAPDPVWGSVWLHHHTRIPPDLHAVLRRVPILRPHPRGQRAHPDGRLRGWSFICPGLRPLQSLPENLLDAPHALDPSPHACGRIVNRLFMPLPVFTIQDFLLPLQEGGGRGVGSLPSPSSQVPSPSSQVPSPSSQVPHFFLSCHHCLRLRYSSLLDRHGWNLFIAHLTRGLLYGHEVPRPDSTRNRPRKRRYIPRTRPAPTRTRVAELLIQGLTSAQIASQLRISRGVVNNHIARLHKLHGVHTRRELIARLCPELPVHAAAALARRPRPIRAQVEQLIAAGRTYHEIAAQLNTAIENVRNQAARLFKEHDVHSRRQLMTKLQLHRATANPDAPRLRIAG